MPIPIEKKRVLIISPYFVPCSTPDMQRVRMSLPYYDQYNWETEVVCVDPKYTGLTPDPLLRKTIPERIPIHYVSALTKERTMKFGLGSIAIRSLWCINKTVSQLLKEKHFDLIFFSTTQYPVCVLGRRWKRQFGVPYLIDIQDPWHTDYYKSKPKSERPKKYWFSYRLNKLLEPYAMRYCDGLMAVSQAYLADLNKRYPFLIQKPQAVIPFGYSMVDFDLAGNLPENQNQATKTLIYAGVLGNHMKVALELLFSNLKYSTIFKTGFKLKLLGTSYAQKSTRLGAKLADMHLLKEQVEEIPQRMSPFETIRQLRAADGLIIFGTDDPSYLGSKLFPYLLTRKPILAILHSKSHTARLLTELSDATVIYLDSDHKINSDKIDQYLLMASKNQQLQLDEAKFPLYNAPNLTRLQADLFEKVYLNQFL